MKTVYQNPDEPECGAACIAMLAGTTLEKAKRALYGDRNPKRVGRKVVLSTLKKDFKRSPMSTRCIRLSSKCKLTDLRGNALLQGATLYKDGKTWRRSLHWLVWDHECQCVRDPLGFADPVMITSATQIQ